MDRKQLAEQIIARAHAEPDHEWHIRRNADGGAAAEDFIRGFDARNARTPAQKDADSRAHWQALLDQIRSGR